jgi:DNA-binding CsgD family transcriptional regulator
MAGGLEDIELPLPALLEAVGRTSGSPLGLIRLDPPTLIYATAELALLLSSVPLGEAQDPARWLLGDNHPADGYEIHRAELPASPHGRYVLVSARIAPESRLELLMDRLVQRYGLSDAEHRELRYLAHGLAIKESARETGLSPDTIRVRRRRVYKKMGLSCHEELLVKLCQAALEVPDQDGPRAA